MTDLPTKPYVVYLVSCVRQKRQNTHPAKDLYTSTWFKLARQYVEQTGRPWFILSAQHGLLRPTELTMAYNTTLNKMTVKEREEWASEVWRQFQFKARTLLPQRVIILAGERYREYLLPHFFAAAIEVEIPLYKLSIEKQLQYLKHTIRHHELRTSHLV